MEAVILSLNEIKAILSGTDLMPAIESGFAAYSAGRAVVPPVGELLLSNGDVHIKYGYIQEEPYYVIKIASGFYENQALGLPTGNGLMLLFKQQTGELIAVLLDEGFLTNVRTALAGAIAARLLAPRNVERIGIVGSGTQARMQLEYLKDVTDCRQVLVWAYDEAELAPYIKSLEPHGFRIETTLDASAILRNCNLVITATPSTVPLLQSSDLRPGTHITAVGSDTPEKQELDPAILKRADLVVADSITQCLLRGEIFKSIQAGLITEEELVELGDILLGNASGRTSEDQITICDLTGVAVQDIKIAEAVYQGYLLS